MHRQEVKMEQLQEYSKEIVDRYLKSMGYDPQHIDRDKRMAFTKTIRFQQFAQRMGEEVEPKLSDKTLKVIEQHTRIHTKAMSLKKSVHVNKPQMPIKTEEVELEEGLKVGDDVAAQVNSASTVFGKVHRVGQTGVHIIVRGQKEPEFYPHKSVYPSSEYEKRNPNPYHEPQKKLKEEEVSEAMEFPQGDFDAKGTSAKVVGEKKISKSAQLIKSIYKQVKEDLYDHEKDDKDGTTYGKKPKMNVSKEETPHADDKTQAAAVLSGGTTLTGQPRDTVEIDPLLKKSKPGSPQDSGDDKNNK